MGQLSIYDHAVKYLDVMDVHSMRICVDMLSKARAESQFVLDAIIDAKYTDVEEDIALFQADVDRFTDIIDKLDTRIKEEIAKGGTPNGS